MAMQDLQVKGMARCAMGLLVSCALALPVANAQHAPGLRSDYDIREARAGEIGEASQTDPALRRYQDGVAKARLRIQQAPSSLRIELNPLLGTVEVISPRAPARWLSEPEVDRTTTLRIFLQQNRDLLCLETADIDDLEVVADYVNPDGRMGWVDLAQRIGGVPVWAGEIRGAFDADGRLVRVLSNILPEVKPTSLAALPTDAEPAIRTAAAAIGRSLPTTPLRQLERSADGQKQTFERAGFADAIVADATVFPLSPGQGRMAWRVLLWEEMDAWTVIVDASSGELLWRRNIAAYQTQAATYAAYPGDSPAPLVPGPVAPNGAQAALVPRLNYTLIGNEPPNTFNNLGWITDGGNTTDGNNAEAGIDRDGVNGIDAGGKPVSAGRAFVYTYNPSPGSPPPGSNPLSGAPPLNDYQRGTITNAFYWANRFHDAFYRLGFTEAARNFQHDNFGRGGVSGDRLTIEVQDSSGTSNANFVGGADGTRGRLQLFLFTGPSPDRDSALDRSVMVHELAHGVSRRLIGNNAGLGGTWGPALGEGWSDFIALALFATPAEPVTGNYVAGAYSVYLFTPGFVDNNFYGIRRFPYAIFSATGGPMNRPFAPQTFADFFSAQLDVSDGAYPPAPWGDTSSYARGEIWALALWEARAKMINRLGQVAGNQRILQFVVDGMKLTPLNPDFIQARDALLAAASAGGSAQDVADVCEGFAIRGMGTTALSTATSVVESFACSIFRNGFDN